MLPPQEGEEDEEEEEDHANPMTRTGAREEGGGERQAGLTAQVVEGDEAKRGNE